MSDFEKNYDDCLNKAIFLLSFRMHTVFELRKKLISRFGKKATNKAINRLLELNYLNDEKFVNTFIEFNKARKSKLVLHKMLLKRGVEKSLADSILENYLPENELISAANNLKKKKYDLTSAEEKNKAISYLNSKGYKYSIIKQVIEDKINLNQF